MKPITGFAFASACWLAKAVKPAHRGVAALVPPTAVCAPLLKIKYICTAPVNATSGMLRMVLDPPCAAMFMVC